MWWLALVPLAGATPDETYARLRDRLVTEYMIVGEGPGESLPATRRRDDWIKWADATVEHGWYLGTLAIEQALLAEPSALPAFAPGRTLDETTEELSLALAAVDRVDAFPAGAFPDCDTSPGALDGFFVRDDVPTSFAERFGITLLETDWTDSSVYLKEMSQDQAVHLLMGLALVRRFSPDADLRQRAAASAARIGVHIANDGTWSIRNPLCDDKVVERGGDAQFYSVGFAAAVAQASGGEPPAEGMFPLLWEDFRNPDHPLYGNSDNRHMVSALAATGASWDDGWDDLLAVSGVEDWDAYPLLYVALHGLPEGADLSAIDARLWADLDALGDAEVMATWPDPAGHPWTTWNRYIRPAADHPAGSEGLGGQRYNGLDWMLAYSLHAAVLRADWPEPESEPEPRACGCATGPAGAGWGLLAATGALARRRRSKADRDPVQRS